MDKAISVTQLSNYVKSIFANEEMLFNISVFGEIGSINNSRGIIYFTLKDESSLINCVCFSGDLIESYCVGDKVIVRGSFNYYSKMGKLSFAVNKIDVFGKGDLFLNFVQLKNKLEQEGLFSLEHKKTLPTNITKIGVVTSETGAVFHDIINVSHRRNPALNIVLSPCKVQGEGADISIIKAIDRLGQTDCDLIIVCRGGGSSEDLSCYNSEALVRCIYNQSKFVLSAVGHETDFTLVDFVSDLRAPTPSAAAELVTKDYKEYIEKINNIKKRISLLKDNMLVNKNDLCINISEAIIQRYLQLITSNEHKLEKIHLKIDSLNPISLAEKGYLKVRRGESYIKSIYDVLNGDKLRIELHNGVVHANVTNIEEAK